MNGPDSLGKLAHPKGMGCAPNLEDGRQLKGEDLFRSLMEMAPDAILIVDQEGTILFANGQAVNWFGYPLDELLGHSIDLLVPDAFRCRHADLR